MLFDKRCIYPLGNDLKENNFSGFMEFRVLSGSAEITWQPSEQNKTGTIQACYEIVNTIMLQLDEFFDDYSNFLKNIYVISLSLGV